MSKRIVTNGIDHNPADPLDYARQWFYRVINGFSEDGSKPSVTIRFDGSPGDIAWEFYDHFLPTHLAPYITPEQPPGLQPWHSAMAREDAIRSVLGAAREESTADAATRVRGQAEALDADMLSACIEVLTDHARKYGEQWETGYRRGWNDAARQLKLRRQAELGAHALRTTKAQVERRLSAEVIGALVSVLEYETAGRVVSADDAPGLAAEHHLSELFMRARKHIAALQEKS